MRVWVGINHERGDGLGHADIKQTQRYLNVTDEALRRAMAGVWERRRPLKAVGQSG